MGEVLGNVLAPLPDERGPDVLLELTAPADWLVQGQRLSVQVPRRLPCARCEGGGCDLCQRSGAFTLREPDEEPESVVLTLSQDAAGSAIQIRLPDHGAVGAIDEVRGQLIVTLRAGDVPSDGLSRIELPRDTTFPWPWIALPVLLVLMYVLVTMLADA